MVCAQEGIIVLFLHQYMQHANVLLETFVHQERVRSDMIIYVQLVINVLTVVYIQKLVLQDITKMKLVSISAK